MTIPERNPKSFDFELAVARDLGIVAAVWALMQIGFFLLPIRASFGC